MRKLLVLLISFILCATSLAFANDINKDNYKKECRIGPIGVDDSFNMKQLNTLFGKLEKPAEQQRLGMDYRLHRLYMQFSDYSVVVVNDHLAIISIKNSKAKNGEQLKTPRGVTVGDSLDKVFTLYGNPDHTWKIDGMTMYTYGSYEYGITFGVMPNNRVNVISVFVPTC